MYILGISAFYHDSAACLIKDGAIVAAAQEERFTRKKHDQNFPLKSIEYCLREAGIPGSELDLVAFYDKPLLKFERILETYLAFAPKGLSSFIKAMPLWIKKKLWIKDLIIHCLDYKGKIIFPEHHESHAASAFFPSPFQEAAFLTIDGVGEWVTTSYGIGRDNRLQITSDIRFPHSLGLLYSAFTYHLGFRVNSAEYKVMGLAPYGKPRYKDLILKELVDLKEDGSFRLNMKYFDYCVGLTMTNENFSALFDVLPRKPETELTALHMDMARSLQEATEEVIFRMARHIRAETGQRNLCMAGGVSLNCVANGKLLREGVFDEIWIQPAAGDAGGALGAALFAWYQHLGNERVVSGSGDFQQGSYLGPSYDNQYIKAFLDETGATYHMLADEELPGHVVKLIDGQNVVGWFQGRMEFGPRALGARSILGDARSHKMQEIMNLKIKFRESFRPFAPAVIAEKAAKYFEIDRDSAYMLLVAPVNKKIRKPLTVQGKSLYGLDMLNAVRSDIPAVTHVDYTARVQTVHEDTNTLFYKLLKNFDDNYGCAVMINTSFNVRGEPIVCTPEDAYRCFMRTDMDYLVLGNFLLDKEKQKPLAEDIDWRKEFELD
jgi:carbamoyltransferase